MKEQVKLVSQAGPTSTYIEVEIDEDGDLIFTGQDLGEAPEEIFGDIDYEYWLTIPAQEKDRVLLALIEKHYEGNSSVISEMRAMLESKGIACKFYSY